jgi:hypothetical protein
MHVFGYVLLNAEKFIVTQRKTRIRVYHVKLGIAMLLEWVLSLFTTVVLPVALLLKSSSAYGVT